MQHLYPQKNEIRFSSPPKFGDPLQEREYSLQRESALLAQTVPLAVAPRCELEINGARYGAGVEVPREKLRPSELNELLRLGVLLRKDVAQLRPKSEYRFVGIPRICHHTGQVVGLSGLAVRGGCVVPGDYVRPEDFDIPPEPPRKHARSDGQIVELPGHPGRDGKVKLAELIAKGYVERVSGPDPQPTKKKAS